MKEKSLDFCSRLFLYTSKMPDCVIKKEEPIFCILPPPHLTNKIAKPPYIISEAKYGSSRLSKGLADGTDQMNIDWIDNRLEKAVSENYASEIRKSLFTKNGNVQSNLFKVKENGDIIIDQLDDAARKMK